MKPLPPCVVLVVLSACGPQLDTVSVEVFPGEVRFSLPEQQAGCRVLEPEFLASANGLGANFEDRGGGECRQIRLGGGSLLALVPSDPNAMVRACSCRPAVLLAKNDDLAPFEVSLCKSADSCSRAAWPAPPAMPTLEALPQADGWLLVRLVRSAPKEPSEFVSISLSSLTSHSFRRPLEDGSVRVLLSEFDTNVIATANWSAWVEPGHCDFASCARRSAISSTTLRLK